MKKFLIPVVFVCGMLTATTFAQDRTRADPFSCFGRYTTFTSRSYALLDACIRETNGDSAWRRLYVRSLCNANWVSDAEQALGDYAMCMSVDQLFRK